MDLDEIINGLDDIDEPACMDKIIYYLELLEEEDDQFMELLLDKFKDAEITWYQPSYQMSYSLTRPLNHSEGSQEHYRVDSITKTERDIIKKNWCEFMKKFDVPDKLICLARWKSKGKSRAPNTPEECARRFVVAYLARGLDRTLYHVFKYIKTYYGSPVKGSYSKGEEKIMQICFTHHPSHAVTILSKILGREPRGIYKRLQQMFEGKPVKKKIKWTLPLATKFIILLMKYTKLPLEELQGKNIEKSVWLKMQNKFDHHYIHLQGFWQESLHVQLFVKCKTKIGRLRQRIFQKLKESSYQVWTDIRWKELVKDFPGYTHRFLYIVSYRVIRPRIYLKTKTLQEIVDFAFERLKTYPFRKRRLKILRCNEDGDLEVVRHNKYADIALM